MIKGLDYPGSTVKYVKTDRETTAAKDSSTKPALPPGKPTLLGVTSPTPAQPRPAKNNQRHSRGVRPTKFNG